MAAKLGKYSSSGFVDSTLVRPKKQDNSTSFVSVEESINAIARANRIRKIITGSLGSILTVIILGYAVTAGTIGMFTFNTGNPNFILRPAFSNGAITGGYIQKEEPIYASLTQPAGTDFISQLVTGISGGAPQAVTGKPATLDYTAKIFINDNGTITVLNNDNTETELEGTYQGNLRGAQQLSDEYIIQCISGDCEKGELLIISKDNIYGVVV